MSAQMTLEEVLNTAGDAIYQCIYKDLNQDLQNRVDDWCELQGLDRLDTPLRVVARQAAFNILLKSTLYEHYQERDILPKLDSDVCTAFQNAQKSTSDPAFNEFVLDEIAWLVDEDELKELIESRQN